MESTSRTELVGTNVEIGLKIDDARVILSAIENLYAHSAVGEGGFSNADMHTLVLIALDKACGAGKLSDELESRIREIRHAA